MKNKASGFLKQVMLVLTSLIKAKSMAVKRKANAVKTRLIIFSLLSNKRFLFGSISHKLHSLLGRHEKRDEDDAGDQSNAIVQYNAIVSNDSHSNPTHTESIEYHDYDDNDGSDQYPDLTHSLFDDDDDLDLADSGGHIIDLVRKSNEDGDNSRLEDNIDEAADLFIRWFRREMKMEKQDSLKSYQEMLARGA